MEAGKIAEFKSLDREARTIMAEKIFNKASSTEEVGVTEWMKLYEKMDQIHKTPVFDLSRLRLDIYTDINISF